MTDLKNKKKWTNDIQPEKYKDTWLRASQELLKMNIIPPAFSQEESILKRGINNE